MNRTVTIEAPAKINLGLEILGRRGDGFHEIRSILAMLTLSDTLSFTLNDQSTGRIRFEPTSDAIDPEHNLIADAIDSFNRRALTFITPDVAVAKRIPVAAGLGGASSDCAASLLAMNELSGRRLSALALLKVASDLGSDVPFFLGSPTAMVSGTGADIAPIKSPTGFVLIVSPDRHIPNKTRTLYGALRNEDFTDGRSVARVAERLNQNGMLQYEDLGNAFEAALGRVDHSMLSFGRSMTDIGISLHWLTGAGPSRFAIFERKSDCDECTRILRSRLAANAQVFMTTFASTGLKVNG